MPKEISDERYFAYIAKATSDKYGIGYDAAVFSIQLQTGIEWNTKSISSVMGISKREVEEAYTSALKKINRYRNGFGVSGRGQMTMFNHDPVDLEFLEG